MIGFNKYKYLKSLSDLSEDDLILIKEYELGQRGGEPDTEFIKSYMAKVNTEPEEKILSLDSWQCWQLFKQGWRLTNKKELELNDDMFSNLQFMNRYFAGQDVNAYLEPLSEFSSKKGLLIVGDYGNGKSSAMKAYRKAFEYYKGYSFKQFSANDVVEQYEMCLEVYQKRDFWKRMVSGVIHFDDVLSEDTASNYGKKEIFKDILEKRYDQGLKTYMTINTRKSGNTKDAIEQLAERYGERVYDRVFEMFNIYLWKGKSYRK